MRSEREEAQGRRQSLTDPSTTYDPLNVHAGADFAELQAIFEASADGMTVLDMAGRIVRSNAFARSLLGCDTHGERLALPAELLARLLAPRSADGAPLPIERWPPLRILSGEALTGAEAPQVVLSPSHDHDLFVSISGVPLYDAAGRLRGAVVIYRDVTERWQVAREARQAQETLLSTAEALLAASRVQPDQPDQQNSHGAGLGTGARARVLSILAEHLLSASHGVMSLSQRTQRALDHSRDLYERAQAESRVLHEANRRMNTFLGIASHELRTPVTTVKTNLQLLVRRLEEVRRPDASAVELRQAVETAYRHALGAVRGMERLVRLVDDLVDVARMEVDQVALRLAPCDLATVIGEAVEEQRQVSPERTIHMQVARAAGDAGVPVVADADRVGQVVTNYLTNALKYSSPHQAVEVSLQREGQHAQLSVRDHGPGLPPSEWARVWERFYRVPGVEVCSGSGVGLGLGLHISKDIIERHGGQVGVESVLGRGSCFWFTLPLARPAT